MSQSESGNPTPPPSFREVSSAYKDIAAHNKKFGFAAVFTSFLELGTKQQEATEIEDTFGPKATEAEMSADLQAILNGDLFTRIGIKLSPVSTGIGNTEDTKISIPSLVPEIENPSLYSEFLSTLTTNDLKDKDSSLLLVAVLDNLYSTVMHSYYYADYPNVYDEEQIQQFRADGENALRTFVQIEANYESLCVDNISEDNCFLENFGYLKKAVEYWGKNVLEEYLNGARDYLVPPGEQAFWSPPTNWHEDGKQWKWKGAFAFMERMATDERTKGLGKEVKQNLIDCIDYAIWEIDTSKQNYPNVVFWPNAAQREDLINVRNYLSGKKYDEKMLDKYIGRDKE
jgi:hypothetical protein